MAGRRDSFFDYKIQAIRIASDFRYPSEIIERIKQAQTEKEISNILTRARKAYIE
jgi:hypothetical protein